MQIFGLTEWHFQDHRGVSTYNEPQMGKKKKNSDFYFQDHRRVLEYSGPQMGKR